MVDMAPLATAGEAIANWFADHAAAIVAIVVVAVVVTVLARLLVGRFQRKLEGAPSITQEINLQRITTLTHALSATAIVIIWVVAFMLILGQLDVNLAPLLASAGVAGVAIGFGAQSVVRDTLAGFFILMENQYGVGDVLEVQTTAAPAMGRVESLTLRITTLRAFDGSLHIVPNGNIQVVSNRSRGWARAIIDVRLAPDEDVSRVRDVLDELFASMRGDSRLDDWIREWPTVLGIETVSEFAKVLRVTAETRPSKRFDVERLLRERITAHLADRGIRVPAAPSTMPTPPTSVSPTD
jgi:small-conductance mechanosensitive channel